MRHEYYEAIRYRRWAELETYAKKWPEQSLADTVYQVLQTIGDKADRKALKKVAYLLEQAGFRGRDYEEEARPEPRSAAARPANKYLVGGMRLANTHGYSMWLVGLNRKGKCEAVMSEQLERFGVFRVGVLDPIPSLYCRGARDRWIGTDEARAVAVDPEYALWRLARAYRKRIPERCQGQDALPPFWQKLVDSVEEIDHPAFAIPRTRMRSRERAHFLAELPLIEHWTLSLAPQFEVWTKIHEIRWAEDESAEEQEREIAQALLDHRDETIEPVVVDFSERLLDAAMLMDRKGDVRAGCLIDATHDLLERTADSDFAQFICTMTARRLSTNLEADDVDPAMGESEGWAWEVS